MLHTQALGVLGLQLLFIQGLSVDEGMGRGLRVLVKKRTGTDDCYRAFRLHTQAFGILGLQLLFVQSLKVRRGEAKAGRRGPWFTSQEWQL